MAVLLPRGRKPTMKNPVKLKAWLIKRAEFFNVDPKLIVVPGVDGAPKSAKLYDPTEGMTPVQIKPAVQKLGPGNPEPVITITPDPKLTDDQIIEVVTERFESLWKLTKGVCEGTIPSLMLTGAGGVGKSHTVTTVVEHYIEHKNLTAAIYSGHITGVELYKLMYKYRHKGNVLVLDDSDGVLDDVTGMTLLKAALDTGLVRRVTWMSNSSALDGIDSQFLYEGSMIFISNRNFKAEIAKGRGKNIVHLAALMTRPHTLDLKLHTEREITLWIKHMINKNHILVARKGLTHEQEQEVLAFMLEHTHNMSNLSIRTALHLADYVNLASGEGNPSEWKKLAKHCILD
jgi:hypothetical protein